MSALSPEQIIQVQIRRVKKHPEYSKDRIALWNSHNVVIADQRALDNYQHGKITKEQLKKEIAKNNYLTEIQELTDTQIDSLLALGYYRRRHGIDRIE